MIISPAAPSAFGAVVLAAGFSSRMKGWKPGIEIDRIPLIVHALIPLIRSCENIVVVGGYQFEKLERLIRDSGKLNKTDQQKLQIIENKKYTAGMFSSVKVGMKETDQSLDGIFVVPGDMPFIQGETYRTLITSFQKQMGIDVFVPAAFTNSSNGEKGELKKGHPILIRQRIRPSILQENDDAILRDVLKRKPSSVCTVDDKGIFLDIDTTMDLERSSALFNS